MYKPSPYRRRRYARRPRKTIKRQPTVSTAVKTYVKRSIHKEIENKVADYIALNQSINSVSGYSFNLVPTLSQGNTSSTRLGNEIRVVSGIVKGYVNLLNYNAITNPITTQRVRIMVISMKFTNSTTLDTGTIWQYGNSSLAVQANLGDCLYKINRDRYVCYYDKTFVLSSPSQSTYTNGLNNNFSNDKFQIPFSINFGKHLKTKIKYDDATSSATNRNMFLWIQSVNADGSATAVTPAEAHVLYEYKFEDA